jgi:hypothetical protein
LATGVQLSSRTGVRFWGAAMLKVGAAGPGGVVADIADDGMTMRAWFA